MTEESFFDVAFRFTRGNGDARPFDEFLDSVIDELEQIGREADYTAQARELIATFTLGVPSGDDADLLGALCDLRTAFHAASCSTHGWEKAAHRFIEARNQSQAELVH